MTAVLLFATVIVPIVLGVVELIKRSTSETLNKNFIPLIAFAVGIFIGFAGQIMKYTLDSLDGDFGKFLLLEDELVQLLIPKNLINLHLDEGDIVEIIKINETYKITLLQGETDDATEKVSSLLEKLRNNK
ncbi:hypothetical protein SAMN05421670_0807 [Psychrobacillus psychrotolerans]|uniref:Uncharacterized protein n=1 Tax=Psychrobacillus psychrotolerans TaxID=126156 RepID=A0A1I5VI11_9BACI|nr:hypothetical protein [Psychrobacillus psychrotolerans]SFQ06626.1 hypothetical protein SAMN05421670_0807 [Psychrobacillus psychrotolerans]